MYQTPTISSRIVSLGTRSYRQRLEAMSGNDITYRKLGRLNKDLDELYELLYSKINSISEVEVKSISPLFAELLKTVNDLHTLCQTSKLSRQRKEEIKRVAMN